MAAIGRRDGLSIVQAMPLIVCNYATIRNLAFDCTAVNGCSTLRILPKSAKRRCKHKVLLKFDIARSSVDVQQHAAISHLALNMVLGQRALSCDLVAVEPQRS